MTYQRWFRTLVLVAFSLLFPSLSFGQVDQQGDIEENPTVPVVLALTEVEKVELEKWLEEDKKYRKWYLKYGNRALYDNKTRIKIRPRPESPIWLTAKCASEEILDPLLKSGCDVLQEIAADANVKLLREKIMAQRLQKESPWNTNLLKYVHIGGFWPVVDDFRRVKYGAVFESHVSIPMPGRLEINLPGIIVLSIPDRTGERVFRIGTDLGLGFRMREFYWPQTTQAFILHFNMVHAWPQGDIASQAGLSQELTLVGFSITAK